ncbi:hypothetical protein Deipr_2158 (plasmid) [Deinococcus proteolyticus MRP]|uniref:Uncharacterized protein n=1 Tax=Deinococcus proteolyticus (strain ATCC 35074 / DSM 20540 / JCM 6276 / NBRC 101906 / NCIMB 13154 / VKM Ac-1939 / CCM 2703 / MRP) TaxID=693977 RepID=F0RPI2_DEIPM|nr:MULTISPECIES: hypothetical protein [Deinococcus]ADY27288.1 hypothetical protein Deipr_2158 [Deinococcus proteolyticus MRP]MCY1704157.1 hypothetical protein [Deinococcus sp. SL84]
MKARRQTAVFAAGLLALLVLAGGWYLSERRWLSDLYCFEQPGQVWSLAPLPASMAPECPASRSYRQEVRQGLGRVEQFRLSGWQPRALLSTFTDAGYLQQTDDLLSGDYSAFLARGTDRIQYSAVRQGSETLITVSGVPQRP